MKKINLFAILVIALLPMTVLAQKYKSFPINNGKDISNAIVYNLAKTDLVIKFKIEKTTRTKGIYSESAYMLGIDNSALKNATTYRIISADICEKIVPNLDKTYILETDGKVSVEKTTAGTLKNIFAKSFDSKLSIDNTPIGESMATNSSKKDINSKNNFAASLSVNPTYEQRLMQQELLVKYPQMTAEKAVAEIKRLRDKQIELLSGSLEGTYMNTTVDYMYKQLDEIINSYVSLFTGIENKEIEEYVFIISPEKPIILEEDLLVPVCKFSKTNGLMDLNENGEGTKILARIHSYVSTEQNAKMNTNNNLTEKQKNRMEKDGVGIYYAIPQTVKVTLQGVDMKNASKIVKLMQYGTIGFTTSFNSNILFDQCSGELIGIW